MITVKRGEVYIQVSNAVAKLLTEIEKINKTQENIRKILSQPNKKEAEKIIKLQESCPHTVVRTYDGYWHDFTEPGNNAACLICEVEGSKYETPAFGSKKFRESAVLHREMSFVARAPLKISLPHGIPQKFAVYMDRVK